MPTPEELRQRTKRFALRVMRLCRSLRGTDEARTIARQLLRCGTSVAANYRAACRARSRAEFIARLGIVVEEADETMFWLELLVDAGIVKQHLLKPLCGEAQELTALFTAAQYTARNKAKLQITNC